MIFSLEALQAFEGDSLILHHGTRNDPYFTVIDGGPKNTYARSLRPRLLEIKNALELDEPLPIELLMVSHIDGDHIVGVLDMFEKLDEARHDNKAPPFRINEIWHNSFDDIVGNGADELLNIAGGAAAAASVFASIPGGDDHAGAVVATVPQGRRLRDLTRGLKIPLNAKFDGKLVMRRKAPIKVVRLPGNVKLTVIAPDFERVKKLQEAWDKALKKAKKAKTKSAAAEALAAAAKLDESPTNLSSIVVLAECNKKTMLLTGDARGDHILDGLKAAKRLDSKGRIHVNILKLPHHGSDRNVSTKFFSSVTADHYVVSADGKHDNPDMATLKMITTARKDDRFTIHLTNDEGKNNLGKNIKTFLKEAKAAGRKFKVVARRSDDLSLRVDLLDEPVA